MQTMYFWEFSLQQLLLQHPFIQPDGAPWPGIPIPEFHGPSQSGLPLSGGLTVLWPGFHYEYFC